MNRHLPVARRTRFQQDESFREILKKKEDEKQRTSHVHNVSEEGTSEKRQDLRSRNSGRFVVGREKSVSEVPVRNCCIADSTVEKGRKQRDVCFSVEKENVDCGTEENPFCIGDDDDDDDDDGPSVCDDRDFDEGIDDDKSDGFEEIHGDDGDGDGDGYGDGDGDGDGDDGGGDDDDDDDDDGDEEEEEEEWKPSSGDSESNSDEDRRTEKKMKTEGPSGFETSNDDSEDDGFWMISKAEYGNGQQVGETIERENEREKTNEATSLEEEVEEVFSSDGDEGREMGNHRERRGRSGFGRSDDDDDVGSDEDDGFWMVSEEGVDREENRPEVRVKEMEKKNEKENSNLSAADIEISSGTSDEGLSVGVEEEDEDESEQDHSVSSAENTDYVAQRTRSCSQRPKKETKSASRPLHFDEDEETECAEIISDSREEEEELEKPTTRKRKCAEAREKKEKELMRRSTKRKLKRGEHGYDVFQILVNSICDKGEVSVEDLVSNEDTKTPTDDDDQPVLPLIFTFEVEELDPPEKSEFDMEMDELWAEMDFAQTYDRIGSSIDNKVEKEDTLPSESCGQGPEGKHSPKLEEEIGLICLYCGKVLLEINYIVPSFEQNRGGRYDFRGLRTSSCSFFDDLGYQDSDCESHSDEGFCARAETVWDIIPGVKNSMYPHQREGFEFIWKHIAGGIHRKNFENIENYTGGNGCIISHAPGTGKSRLTIVFLQTYMKLHPKCLPLIIAPRSMLLTWEEEFRKWKVDIPFHNLNIDDLSGKEDKNVLKLLRHSGREDIDTIRLVKLYSWKKGGSILAISYTLFEKLVTGQKDAKGEVFGKILVDLPDLMVLDEGHRPRNNQSLIWQALSKVRTHKRIILSGTPFQNNFNELYNTMCMVQPKFPETCGMKRGRKGKERKEWADLTKFIGKFDDSQMVRLKQIKSFIDPLVHIHRGDVLDESLPGLRESIVVLKPFELQKSLLREIEVTKRQQFVFENAVSLISVHPSLLLESKVEMSSVKRDELKRLGSNPDAGVKTKFLIELIKLSTAMNERVLVFSEYLSSLFLVREFLVFKFGWREKKEVLYIDGQCDIKERQCSINKLNDPSSEAKVVLASIKACGEGINLVGASRVVLLDVVWNPSLERQATRRAYRLGQKKVVYVYHLIASGTMEEDKYSRQAEKDRLSKLVFSSSDSTGHQQKTHPRVPEDKILELMVQHENLKPIFERISFKQKDNQPMSSSEPDI